MTPILEMTVDIVCSLVKAGKINAADVPKHLQDTAKALMATGNESTENTTSTDIVTIKPQDSIRKSAIVCMECGQEFKMLSPKHLASHGLTADEYRKKHGFKRRQPLCAKALSASRKKAGQERGIPENLKKAIQDKKGKKTT